MWRSTTEQCSNLLILWFQPFILWYICRGEAYLTIKRGRPWASETSAFVLLLKKPPKEDLFSYTSESETKFGRINMRRDIIQDPDLPFVLYFVVSVCLSFSFEPAYQMKRNNSDLAPMVFKMCLLRRYRSKIIYRIFLLLGNRLLVSKILLVAHTENIDLLRLSL